MTDRPARNKHLARAVVTALWLCASASAGAQRADSARVGATGRTIDTSSRAAPKPPLSPRRAFLYSLVLPGYAQSRLGRPTAGAIFVLSESIAIAFLRESAAELREARRFRTDSLVFLGNDPTSGLPVSQRSGFSDELINIRRGHVEDWIAYLFANHLFAAADAYVAAHLFDLPSQVAVRATANGTVVVARLSW